MNGHSYVWLLNWVIITTLYLKFPFGRLVSMFRSLSIDEYILFSPFLLSSMSMVPRDLTGSFQTKGQHVDIIYLSY